MYSYQGDFEAHITVGELQGDQLAYFKLVCQDLGVKPILIQLSRGKHVMQPMTSSNHAGTLEQVVTRLKEIAEEFRHPKNSWNVTRIKVEAAPWNTDIPQNNNEASKHPETNYFEYHLKLLLGGEEERITAKYACELHGAHLSSNAFKKRSDGKIENFATMRSYGTGKAEAELLFEAFRQDMEKSQIEVGKSVLEYTVYDTNLGLDDAWLEE